MNITRTIISALLLACPLLGMAQSTPAIAPSFTYTDSKGNEQTVTSADDQAPLAATFHANATDTEGWNAHYEWHFYLEGQRSNPYLVRYETDTQYTFTKAGTHLVEL
ncbi:MAG: gliding motility-associated C-terminal domain-containing protein, partial [Prevotella sp.]|nr:gliding motility-associated C-terminal domain-containing protein [Prevotella sp.]